MILTQSPLSQQLHPSFPSSQFLTSPPLSSHPPLANMGLKGFYPWLRKKKGYHPTLRHPMHHHLPDDAIIRVDVLSFFTKIRGIYTKHADDKTKAQAILFEHLKKYGDPSHMVFYVDGAPALEKKETHRERNEKRAKALKNAKVAIETLGNRINQGKPPTKQMFKNVERSLRGGFKWSLQDREDFVHFLQAQELDAHLCRTEADIDIAAECQPKDVVLTQDSDFFAYDSVTTIWRPVGKWDDVKVLEYSREAVLAQIRLSTTKLTALACVSSNDQNKNIPSMGIATNYSIIKDLPDTDVPSLVKEYLESPRVVCRGQEGIDFTASILVFTTMTQEIAAPAGVSSVPSPSSQSVTPLTASAASILSYELLCHQYKVIKDQHARAKEQKRQGNSSSKSNSKPNRQGKHREFRRHRVIDRPAHQPRVSQQVHRPRHSYKSRAEPQQHEQPSICKQYERKPYTAEQEARYRESTAEARGKKAKKKRHRETQRLKKEKEVAKKPPPKIDEMNKAQLINAMMYEHPLVSLQVGTVNANSKRAAAATTTNANQLPSSEQQKQQQQQEVSACILDIVGQVRATKRHAQEFLGTFIETVFESGLTENDRIILYSLCPVVESKIRMVPQPKQDSQARSSSSAGTPTKVEGNKDTEDEGDEDAEDEGDEDAENEGDEDAEPSAMDKPFFAFYQILLAHIYSRKIKFKTVAERQVGQLLTRATSLGITLPSVPPRDISYQTNGLLESTTKQLYCSIKKMYRNGSVALEKKINSQADVQPGTVLPNIDPKLPAIENYLLLNKATGGSRRIAPLSPLAPRYVSFSERQLLPLFWSWPTLKDKIRRMMNEDRYFQDPAIVPSQADALDWLARTTPGRLITSFLSDVGLPPDKHDKGYRKTTTVMDMDGKGGKEGLREHLKCLRAETFNPRDWHNKVYVLKGSIRTNGRLLQLLAYKLKELQSVRYRRIPENKAPNPLLTTIGGINRYLTEARNVFFSAADVENLLATDPSQVTVLSLDLGTSCIVGATASFPPGQSPTTLARPLCQDGGQKKRKKKGRRAKLKPGDRKRQRKRQKARKLGGRSLAIRCFDLVVKRKAVSRPTDSFSNWLEDRRENTIGPSTGRTIQKIETALPPLKGEGASFCEYVAMRRASEEDLDTFYNNTNFWKHKWDSNICRKEEYYKVAEGLLNMIGGSVGRPRLPHQNVVIAIGLAKFTAVHGPPALDGTFQAFFISLRDVMASENMNNAIKGHLIHQQRPHYLQPRRQDGSYPWMDVAAGDGSGGGGGEAAGPSAVAMDSNGDEAGGGGGGGAVTARKRRAASIVSVEVPDTGIYPMTDALSSSSSHMGKKAK
ncbi:hypothetical protein F5H01DRAFT_405658 [Linnemannia elongata]|nr:hypothetical protein F5H01DRAFT_405658 [Linnemannia elongata]